MAKLDDIVLGYRDLFIKNLQELVRIPSLEGPAQPGAPFGREVARALEAALRQAHDLGLTARSYDNYLGLVEAGAGTETMGILAHLDVVPEGDNWSYPPYGGVYEDGRIYGRGTSDNKCACVAAMLALRAVLDAGYTLNKRVLIMLGCDEESGFTDIAYYKEREKMPDFGFSPDAGFPVINAEKGICHMELSASFAPAADGTRIKSFAGGSRPNVVPDHASAVIAADSVGNAEALAAAILAEAEKRGYTVCAKTANDEVIVDCEGVSAHAAAPEGGRNAVGQLLEVLSAVNADERADAGKALAGYATLLGTQFTGEGLGIHFSDEPSGPLTCNLGIFNQDAVSAKATLDIRYPVTEDCDRIIANIRAACAPYGMTAACIEHKKPLYLPPDHPFLKTLLEVYTEVTGLEAYTLSMGGGTYARTFDNAVAFGPGFPGGKTGGGAHQKDEYVVVDSILLATRVYAHVIARLAAAQD